MPETTLRELPQGWEDRAVVRQLSRLRLVVPAPPDLLAPKLRRGEPRDRAQAEWAARVGLIPR